MRGMIRLEPDVYEVRWLWWRRYGVFYLRVRSASGGRQVADFRGKFAKLWATHRAQRLLNKWRDAHRPPHVFEPPPNVLRVRA